MGQCLHEASHGHHRQVCPGPGPGHMGGAVPVQWSGMGCRNVAS